LTKLQLKVSKKKLHFSLGQLVVPAKEPDAKPYCICGFLPIGGWENYNADYAAVQISKRGKIKNRIFEQKDLKPYKK
jgi:hypothetical protein